MKILNVTQISVTPTPLLQAVTVISMKKYPVELESAFALSNLKEKPVAMSVKMGSVLPGPPPAEPISARTVAMNLERTVTRDIRLNAVWTAKNVLVTSRSTIMQGRVAHQCYRGSVSLRVPKWFSSKMSS